MEPLTILLDDLITVNWLYYSGAFGMQAEALLRWIGFAVGTAVMVWYACRVLSMKQPSKASLYMLRIISIPSLLALPLLVPSKAFSLFLAVQNFCFCMIIYSESFDLLAAAGDMPSRSFKDQMNSLLFFNVPRRILREGEGKLPTFMQTVHGLILLTIADMCNFLCRELIPHYISAPNRTMAISLVGALWITCALDYAYWFAGTVAIALGKPMANAMYHHNPLLSLSMGEFWSIRWNPILGKQLQASFFKPALAMGLPRPIAVMACFTGSALLHAIPKLISEVHWRECGMMFAFFFSQGVMVLGEGLLGSAYLAIVNKMNWTFLPTFSEPKDVKKEDKLSLEEHLSIGRGRLFLEVMVIFSIWSLWYHTVEATWNTFAIIAHVLSSIAILYNVVSVRLQLPAEAAEFAKHPVTAVLFIVARWLMTIACIIPFMPYFNQPMMSAIAEYSSCSLVIAPCVRTAQKLLFIAYGYM